MDSLVEKLSGLWPRSGLLASKLVRALLARVALLAVVAPALAWGRSPMEALAVVALAALCIVVGDTYLARTRPRARERTRGGLVVSLLVAGSVHLTWLHSLLAPGVSPFVLPLPVAAMVATMLVGPPAGMFVAAASVGAGVLQGVLAGPAVFAALLTDVAAIASMSSLKDRARLAAGTSTVIAVMAIAAAAAAALSGEHVDRVVSELGLGAVGGVVTVVAALGLLAVFEALFGVTSDVRLLELANPSAPLMRRLMLEAPGTYTHAILTGNLAEAAAQAIGADPLLARVGAYYHDVGKLVRPAFFVENQTGCANPHANTSPSLSALIITAHVREGAALAEQHHLPPEVVDIIRQHHGTSVVAYFYQKAAASGDPVVEADFRYSGELPSSREAAIVMLADAAEAAVRAMTKPTPPRIEECVRRVVESKLADHQLDRADLTFADMERIVEVYTRMLSGLYHPRIEYPSMMHERESHAGTRDEPSRS
ncbi:MAG: HDIG domain-containing protein [Anaerosomatales bacterium]|nr:HDIG domain-containing protein [Anaerosomatales bacterium]